MAAHFVWLKHGKESAALDLTDPADREVFTRLLDRADVLISNLAPGALPRLGLAPQSLAERYPRLIIVDISGYGTGGPLDHKRAYDLLVQAEGGSCAITGLPGQPAKPGIPIADIGTALYAYSAVLAPRVRPGAHRPGHDCATRDARRRRGDDGVRAQPCPAWQGGAAAGRHGLPDGGALQRLCHG